MKKMISLLFMVIISGIIIAPQAKSQCPSDLKGNPKCPDHLLYEDQAVIRIQDFTQKIKILEDKLKTAKDDFASLEKELQDTKKALDDCNEALYKMLDANLAEINNFRQKIGVIDGKIRAMQRLSDDVLADKQDEVFALEAELNELRKEKIAMHPEFFDRIIAMAKSINPGLIREKKIKEYIVRSWFENRDCLWNIAGNVDIYGDPFQWPKIWQANTSIVRNPDIIHPGQMLTIPEKGPKSTDELKAERRYWRDKQEAMESESTGEKGQ